MFRSFIALVPVIALAAFVPAAHAEDRDSTRVHVAVRADDFSSPTHVRDLYGRIKQAARSICDDGFGEDLFDAIKAERECRDQAVSDAVHDLNSPELSALDRPGKMEKAPEGTTYADRLASR